MKINAIIFTWIACLISEQSAAPCLPLLCGTFSERNPSQRSSHQMDSLPFRSSQLPPAGHATSPSLSTNEQRDSSTSTPNKIKSHCIFKTIQNGIKAVKDLILNALFKPSQPEAKKNEVESSNTLKEENPKPQKREYKNEDEDEWEGTKPLTEERPELYTTNENVKLIRRFSDNMTLEGKYKVGEIILYLLTERKEELDNADKAAIEYAINERMKKDPELMKRYKKYNEKYNNGNETTPTPFPHNQQDSDEDMPFHMRQLLSPSFSSLHFETSTQTDNSTNSAPNTGRNFFRNMSPGIDEVPFRPQVNPVVQHILQTADDESHNDFLAHIFGGNTRVPPTETHLSLPSSFRSSETQNPFIPSAGRWSLPPTTTWNLPRARRRTLLSP